MQLDPVYNDRVIKLLPLESVKIVSGNLSLDAGFILFQAHTQLDPIIMSYEDSSGRDASRIKPDQKVVGKNVGLVVHLKGEDSDAGIFVKNSNYESVNVLVITSIHSAEGQDYF